MAQKNRRRKERKQREKEQEQKQTVNAAYFELAGGEAKRGDEVLDRLPRAPVTTRRRN